MMRKEAALLFVGIVVGWVAIQAQVATTRARGVGPVPPGGCSDGVVHDDGSVEAGYGFLPATHRAGFVEPFDVGTISGDLATVCVCLIADLMFPVPDRELLFEVVVYDDDGPGGIPGSLLASIPAHADEIPVVLPGAIYSVDVDSATSRAMPSVGTVFIGVQWDPIAEGSVFFVCDDADQPPHGGFTFFDGWFDWTPIQDEFPIHYGSMVIRAKGRVPSVVEIPTLSLYGVVALALTLGLLGWRRTTRLGDAETMNNK